MTSQNRGFAQLRSAGPAPGCARAYGDAGGLSASVLMKCRTCSYCAMAHGHRTSGAPAYARAAFAAILTVPSWRSATALVLESYGTREVACSTNSAAKLSTSGPIKDKSLSTCQRPIVPSASLPLTRRTNSWAALATSLPVRRTRKK